MQIYAEAESNANLFVNAEAQQYMWTKSKLRRNREHRKLIYSAEVPQCMCEGWIKS